jgi:hypothetical protein
VSAPVAPVPAPSAPAKVQAVDGTPPFVDTDPLGSGGSTAADPTTRGAAANASPVPQDGAAKTVRPGDRAASTSQPSDSHLAQPGERRLVLTAAALIGIVALARIVFGSPQRSRRSDLEGTPAPDFPKV